FRRPPPLRRLSPCHLEPDRPLRLERPGARSLARGRGQSLAGRRGAHTECRHPEGGRSGGAGDRFLRRPGLLVEPGRQRHLRPDRVRRRRLRRAFAGRLDRHHSGGPRPARPLDVVPRHRAHVAGFVGPRRQPAGRLLAPRSLQGTALSLTGRSCCLPRIREALISERLAGKTLLVTGSTGFVGKSIVEKLLRSVPEVGRVTLAIRSSPRRPAADRLDKEVLSSPAFRRLKEELGEEGFRKLEAEKLTVLEIDLGRDGLGLSEAGRKELLGCDIVIHSAAAVEFDNPADLSAQTNLLGASRLVRTLSEAGSKAGRVHARAMGFTDIYSFTKAMAERAVVELHGQVPLSILRPSIIESSLAEPFPGWLEGFRMAEPIILAFARRVLPDFAGLPDTVLDLIPADLVVNSVLAVAASPPGPGDHRIYHAATGNRNPLRLRAMVDLCREYFEIHPLRHRYGQAIGPPEWTFPPQNEVEGRAKAMKAAI